MNSSNQCEQVDVKDGEDPLSINEIKIEPHDIKCELSIELDECDRFATHVDIKHEIETTNKSLKEEPIQGSLTDYLSDDDKSRETKQIIVKDETETEIIIKDEIKTMSVDHDSCETYEADVEENKCGVPVCKHVTDDESSASIILHKNKYIYKNEPSRDNFSDRTVSNNSTLIQDLCTSTKDESFIAGVENSFSQELSLLRGDSQPLKSNEPYTCNFCKKAFSQKRYLIRHMRTHTHQKPFSCDICMKSFSQKKFLVHHIRIHTNEKPFNCGICEMRFCQQTDLVRHTRTHTNEKPFACATCMKCFSRRSYLSHHIRIHTNEKPFKCSLCMKCFISNSHLSQHVRTHTNEKPFACKICMKSFYRKSNLSDHSYTHKNEKPFICNLCMKSFSQKKHLAQHIRTHSNVKSIKS